MKLHLNIGLARNDGKADNGLLRTVAVLNQCGFLIYAADVQQSSTEQTLCATVQHVKNYCYLKFDLHNVASRLGQDCIASLEISVTGRLVNGALHGPESAKWGRFDPQYFLFPKVQESA
jgi:hypothetical protein